MLMNDPRYAPRTMRQTPIFTVRLGLLGALAAHRVTAGLLEVPVLGAVGLLLPGTAWLASWLPARGAASVDPASVLRRG